MLQLVFDQRMLAFITDEPYFVPGSGRRPMVIKPSEPAFEDLLRCGDRALYMAKDAGRDRYVVG